MKRPTSALISFILGVFSMTAGALCGAESQSITVLHTSDLHGQILSVDDARGGPARGSLAQAARLVEQIRGSVDHPVLLVDSGDTIQGSPLEQFVHVRWGEPSPTITMMNLMGYDAMAVGNHEFNFGLEVLRRAEATAEFPFLSANTVSEKDGAPAFPPFTIVEVGAVRVGLLGLTTPNIPHWEQPRNYRGVRFEAMDEVASRWVRRLRDDHGCDLVVVLAHTGFERDLSTGEGNDTDFENYGWRLTGVSGVDLLLTGHAHENIAPREVRGVIVAQPSARGRILTRIDLELEKGADGWEITSWSGDNLPTAEVAPLEALEERFETLHGRVVAALDGPVGEVSETVSVNGCRLRDCAPLDLLHAVQLEASGAQLSLASLLSSSTPDVGPGPVPWRWVHALYVYPNTLVAVQVNGRQVKDVLEHAARYYGGLECSSDAGCLVLTDPSVRHYNVDTMAGVTYRIDPTRDGGDRVRDLRYEGRPLDLHETFTLVCNNYRAAGGGGYPHLAEAGVVWRSSEEMTDLIGDFLGRQQLWRPAIDNNWWIGAEIVAARHLSRGR